MDDKRQWFIDQINSLYLNHNITAEERDAYIQQYDYYEANRFDEEASVNALANEPDTYYDGGNKFYLKAARNAAMGDVVRTDLIYLFGRQIHEAANQGHIIVLPKHFNFNEYNSGYARRISSAANETPNLKLEEATGIEKPTDKSPDDLAQTLYEQPIQNFVANMSRFVPTQVLINNFSLQNENSYANKTGAQYLLLDHKPLDFRVGKAMYEAGKAIKNTKLFLRAFGVAKPFDWGFNQDREEIEVMRGITVAVRDGVKNYLSKYVYSYKPIGDLAVKFDPRSKFATEIVKKLPGVEGAGAYYKLVSVLKEFSVQGITEPSDVKRKLFEKIGVELPSTDFDVISAQEFRNRANNIAITKGNLHGGQRYTNIKPITPIGIPASSVGQEKIDGSKLLGI